MGVSKEAKEKIVRLMLQDVPTEEIAAITNYSISTIRTTFEELRDEFGVNSKVGIARAYLQRELLELNKHIQNILKLLGSRQITTNPENNQSEEKGQKRKKN